MESNSGLSCTGAVAIKRIKHTARAISIWLFHLLRPDVNSPPNRAIHCDILVEDVLNEPSARIPWVCFYIDGFERADEFDISESDIADTIATWVRRNTADTHTNSQYHWAILNQHILGAVTSRWSLIAGFWHNNIIIVLHSEIKNMHTGTTGINSICIEWEKWDQTL